jgi:hypothetical protein
MAGILAAVLPGAGHLYTDRPGDALVAFLLNGAFIWAAVELFRHENYVTGNIYDAVNSAYEYNKSDKDNLIRQMIKIMNFFPS